MSTGEIRDNDYCFACGELNPLGLHLKSAQEGEKLKATCRTSPHHQGFAGVVHGGIIATILDDAMNNLVTRLTGMTVVTAELRLRLRRPVPVDEAVVAEAELIERRAGVFRARAMLYLRASGELVAASESELMAAPREAMSSPSEAD